MSSQDQLITVNSSLFPNLDSWQLGHIRELSFEHRIVFKDHKTFHFAAHIH